MERATNPTTSFLVILAVALLATLLVGALWIRIKDFCEELDYINMEIRRSSYRERPKWRRRRRRLWLWLFFLSGK